MVPTFFSIIYCNKTTDLLHFDFPKHFFFKEIHLSKLNKLLLNYPSRFAVQIGNISKYVSKDCI